MIEKQLSDINFEKLCEGRKYYESPSKWNEQVLYFLLPDRFSDGKEQNYRDADGNLVTSGTTPLYTPSDNGNAVRNEQDAKNWRDSGEKWVGGTINGIKSKLGYLKRMGVTSIWVGPIFKQVPYKNTYHGYGIQNFLDVDPHFGTREELKSLVEAAHKLGIYVIMDIIVNHTGDVFKYSECHIHDNGQACDTRWDGSKYYSDDFNVWKNSNRYDVEASSDIGINPGNATDYNNLWPDGAIWPREFQNEDFFNREGHITNWNYEPEYLEGDFYDLKDINLQSANKDIDKYEPTDALKALCQVYKCWIAYADIDGYRIDTVKHVTPGAVRYFANSIHEFATYLGKNNFYLIGEITGGRDNAFHTLEVTGLDAALGIDDVQERMIKMVKGETDPSLYFDLFRNSLLVEKDSHKWFMDKVVTMADDHDKVPQGNTKSRFSAFVDSSKVQELAFNVLAVNATTMGIPCIYYGSEAAFDGNGGSDRYIREAMFGGSFGAFRSSGRHFFNEDIFTYKEIAKLLEIRRKNKIILGGRQYLREISGNGLDFGYPQGFGGKLLSIVAWSRVFNDIEVVIAFNTDMYNTQSSWVLIDKALHNSGDKFSCIYSSNDKSKEGEQLTVESKKNNEVNALKITVPACGFLIYEKYNPNVSGTIH
ncbi:MAG TPA: alpha-amylase family glycosyl hydrolase [Clostridia bacterium]